MLGEEWGELGEVLRRQVQQAALEKNSRHWGTSVGPIQGNDVNKIKSTTQGLSWRAGSGHQKPPKVQSHQLAASFQKKTSVKGGRETKVQYQPYGIRKYI